MHTSTLRRIMPVMLLLLLCTIQPNTVYAGINVWTSIGPDGGETHTIAIDPTTTTTLYAGSQGGGVFKSTNGGGQWSGANTGLTDLFILSLAIDPLTPTTIYAGSRDSGVFKSTNSGESWVASNNGLNGTHVTTLTIDPLTPTTLYALTWNGVYKSINGGDNWGSANTGLTDPSTQAMAIDPATPTTLYVGMGSVVYKSINSGGNWSAVNSTGLTGNAILALVVDPLTPATIYIGTTGGVFKSTIGGGDWSAANIGLTSTYVQSLAIDRTNPITLYAGTTGGVFKSTDGGGNWNAINTSLTDTYVYTLSIDPQNSAILYAGTKTGGVFKSTNSGGNWTAASNHLTNTNVQTLVIDPSAQTTFYAQTWGNGIFKSINSGGNWSAINTDLPETNFYNTLAVDPGTPATLYVGAYCDGVYKSTNGGTNWSAVNTGLTGTNQCITGLVIDPATPTTLYVGAGTNGVYKSTNGGGNWSTASTGLPAYTSITSLIIDPLSPVTLYAGTDDRGAYKTTNGGASWSTANLGPSSRIRSFAIDPTNPATLYAGTLGYIYKSINGGTNWSVAYTAPANTFIYALAIDPFTTTTVYAGINDRVYKSTDGGASWFAIGTDLPTISILTLTIDRVSPGTLYAGTAGNGVFVIQQVPTYSISGTITTAGNSPLADVTVSDGSGHTTSTDANGAYTLTGLMPGNYSIAPAKAGYNFAPQSILVEVTSSNVPGIDFSASVIPVRLSGWITLNGNGLSGVTVTITGGGTTTTSGDGSYVFTGLLPGFYTVTPTAAGYTFAPPSQTLAISADAGNVNFAAIQDPTYTISGQVKNTSGTAIAGVVIADGSGQYAATTTGDGRYTLSGLPKGNYALSASRSDLTFYPEILPVSIIDGNIADKNFTALPVPKPIDVTISLYKTATIEERSEYENIMGYFADAIFEMSNGANKVRNVTIYQNGAYPGADVLWNVLEYPRSDPIGYGVFGKHIWMGNFFEFRDKNNNLTPYDALDTEFNRRQAGYVLGHEWGHFYYGLYDEYVDPRNVSDFRFYFPRPDDVLVNNSIMGDQWKAANTNDYNWLNFSVAGETQNGKGKTAQDRMYGVSGWETLTRPAWMDNYLYELYAIPKRTFYPELFFAAPQTGQPASLELGVIPSTVTRSMLNVTWIEPAAPVLLANPSADYKVAINSISGDEITYPAPLLLVASALKNDPIVKANLAATLTAPNGTLESLSLKDDGVAPDIMANDGLYSGIALYKQNGVYQISVSLNNDNGLAEYTQASAMHSIGPNGETYVPMTQLVGEAFHQSGTLAVTVTGVRPDDYGDAPPTATPLSPDNIRVAGQIDRAGDIDVFKILPSYTGKLAVRLTNVGMGMIPKVHILKADGKTLIGEYTFTPSSERYLVALLDVVVDDPAYVLVSHQNAGASEGFYMISGGPEIISDAGFGHKIFVPVAIR